MSSYIEGITDYCNGVSITNKEKPVKHTNASILWDVDLLESEISGSIF